MQSLRKDRSYLLSPSRKKRYIYKDEEDLSCKDNRQKKKSKITRFGYETDHLDDTSGGKKRTEKGKWDDHTIEQEKKSDLSSSRESKRLHDTKGTS